MTIANSQSRCLWLRTFHARFDNNLTGWVATFSVTSDNENNLCESPESMKTTITVDGVKIELTETMKELSKQGKEIRRRAQSASRHETRWSAVSSTIAFNTSKASTRRRRKPFCGSLSKEPNTGTSWTKGYVGPSAAPKRPSRPSNTAQAKDPRDCEEPSTNGLSKARRSSPECSGTIHPA